MSCRSQVEICVVCEEDHSAPAPGAVGGVAVGEEPQLPAACVYAAKADPLAEVRHELQDVLRKLFRGVHQADDGLELLQRFVT